MILGMGFWEWYGGFQEDLYTWIKTKKWRE